MGSLAMDYRVFASLLQISDVYNHFSLQKKIPPCPERPGPPHPHPHPKEEPLQALFRFPAMVENTCISEMRGDLRPGTSALLYSHQGTCLHPLWLLSRLQQFSCLSGLRSRDGTKAQLCGHHTAIQMLPVRQKVIGEKSLGSARERRRGFKGHGPLTSHCGDLHSHARGEASECIQYLIDGSPLIPMPGRRAAFVTHGYKCWDIMSTGATRFNISVLNAKYLFIYFFSFHIYLLGGLHFSSGTLLLPPVGCKLYCRIRVLFPACKWSQTIAIIISTIFFIDFFFIY